MGVGGAGGVDASPSSWSSSQGGGAVVGCFGPRCARSQHLCLMTMRATEGTRRLHLCLAVARVVAAVAVAAPMAA